MLKAAYLSLIFIFIGTIYWIKKPHSRQKDIKVIDLISKLDFILKEKGKLYTRNDTVQLCFLDGLTIYREKYPYEKYNGNAIHGDTVVISDDSKTIDFREFRYDYFIWKNDAKSGLKYTGEGLIKIINVDSIRKIKLFKNAKFYDTIYDRLENRKFSQDQNSFQETYVNFYKPNESYCDSTYYTFSVNFIKIPYSPSLIADSIKKAKLVEVRYIYNSIPKGIDNKMDIPRREMIFKIAVTRTDHIEIFRSISEKFKTDIKKLNLK